MYPHNQRCEAPLTCHLSPCVMRQAELTLERVQRRFIATHTVDTVQSIEEQVAEDTCTAHGTFCCRECFDI